MAVSAKPKHKPAPTTDEAMKFIEGAEKPKTDKPEESERKIRVVLYFDQDILDALDKEVAKRRGSRGSVVRELIARHIMSAE